MHGIKKYEWNLNYHTCMDKKKLFKVYLGMHTKKSS